MFYISMIYIQWMIQSLLQSTEIIKIETKPAMRPEHGTFTESK